MSLNESRSFQKFRSRMEYINQHLQMIDISLKSTAKYLNKARLKSQTITSFLRLDENIYDLLNHPISSKARLFSYSRSKNSQYAMIELYNSFSCYLKDLLNEFFEKEPIKIAGKAQKQSLTFVEIVQLGSYDNISDEIVSKVFRKLENERDTSKLLDKILNHTNIEINEQVKLEGLMYLELRHLIIHNNCKADSKFKTKYHSKIQINSDDKIPMTYDIISKALISISDLAKHIDHSLIEESFIDTR